MKNAILVLMALVLVTLASIVPWADAQQKPSNVLIWCQNTNGTSSPCVAGNSLDYDTGGGTVAQSTVGIVLPGSGGPVAGGTSSAPFRVDPTGTTPQPVTQSGSWSLAANQSVNISQINGVTPLMGAGNTGTGSHRTTEATDSQLSAGVGATGDAAATVGSTGSLTAKLRLVTSQLDAIQTAVQLIDNIVSGSGANISQINGATAQVASNGLNTTGAGLQANALAGQCDDTSPAALTENQFGHWRINCSTHHGLVEVAAALPTGSNVIGALSANQTVNVAQINGVAPLMGAGNTGTGSHRVTEATDSQLSAGVGATGDAAATAGSTGSLNAKLRLMSSQLDTISTSLATLITSSQLIDDDQTGATMLHRISVGTTEDEHQVKGSAGRLFSINVTNTNAAVRYLRCADQVAASTTPGTTTVWYGMAIPGATTGGGYTANFGPNGAAFSTGLTCWLVTGAAESDVAEVAANEINVNYTYK